MLWRAGAYCLKYFVFLLLEWSLHFCVGGYRFFPWVDVIMILNAIWCIVWQQNLSLDCTFFCFCFIASFLFAFLVEQGWLWYLWYLSLMTLTFDILKDCEKCYSITLLRTTVFYTVYIRLLMKIDSDCVSQITGRVYFLKIFCGYLLLIWLNDSSNETFTKQLHIRE